MRTNINCFSANVFHKSLPCVLVASMSLVLVGCGGGGSDSGGPVSDIDPTDGITESEDLFPGFEPSDEITEAEVGTINDQIRDDIDFGRLVSLLQQADLEVLLDGDNDGLGWTLFAPQDIVFDQDTDFQALNTFAEQNERTRGLVASGRFDFSDLTPGNSITMQDGNEALIELAPDGASLIVGGATIAMMGIVVENGVLYRVDSLITTQ